MKDITKSDWIAYRLVQDSGMHNMMSPDAVRASGLNKNVYFAILKNYDPQTFADLVYKIEKELKVK